MSNNKQSLSWMYQGEEMLRKEKEELEKEDYLLGNKKIHDKMAEDDVSRLRKNEAAGAIFLSNYNKETDTNKKLVQNQNDPLFQLQLQKEKLQLEKEKHKKEKKERKEQKKKRKLEKLSKEDQDKSINTKETDSKVKEKKRKLSEEEKKQKLEEMRKDAQILQKTRLESQLEAADEIEKRSAQKSDSNFLNKIQKEAYWNPSKKQYK